MSAKVAPSARWSSSSTDVLAALDITSSCRERSSKSVLPQRATWLPGLTSTCRSVALGRLSSTVRSVRLADDGCLRWRAPTDSVKRSSSTRVDARARCAGVQTCVAGTGGARRSLLPRRRCLLRVRLGRLRHGLDLRQLLSIQGPRRDLRGHHAQSDSRRDRTGCACDRSWGGSGVAAPSPRQPLALPSGRAALVDKPVITCRLHGLHLARRDALRGALSIAFL